MNNMKQEDKEKVKAESDVLMVFNHPNIIKFERAYKDQSKRWNIVMEFADGGNLGDIINRRKEINSPFSEDELLNYFT
eukprot:CAMPEP_0170463150 /NCGR_PEP_ID=MMETSP0123-20130129/8376_1 /TAXON_ID=182087 /ORGANISM="Favella ehrenbergii, Strain Fehren 1" /LENGTH=77 /DNA_ID=CAMNT_0010728523 /DNA_START=155 /DNA_END=388 /DNA_ORIENTATION=-